MKNQNNNTRTKIYGTVAIAPEMKTTASGRHMATCMVLSHEKTIASDGQPTIKKVWRRVVAWGKQGEFINRNLMPGRKVTLECSERNIAYTNMEGKQKQVHEFTLSKVLFLGKEVKSVIKTPTGC